MPCSDVADLVRIALGSDDRLKSYALTKRACGRSVGDSSFLEDRLRGRTVDELLALTPGAFFDEASSDMDAFLLRKHLHAIQSTLAVYTGRQPGGPAAACALADVAHEDGDLVIHGRIKVDVDTDAIPPCAPCGGCDDEPETIGLGQ